MDDFESDFKSLNVQIKNWNDLLERESLDVRNTEGFDKYDKNVQLLPRQDISLYGIIPKMEKRAFTCCKGCKHVFNPKDILLHKTCSLKSKTLQLAQTKKSIKTKKKLPIPLPPLFTKEAQADREPFATELPPDGPPLVNATTASAKPIDITATITFEEDVKDIPLPPATEVPTRSTEVIAVDRTATETSTNVTSSTSSTSSISHSNKVKKSKKSSNKLVKGFDPDIHCGVTDSSKAPCTRSITCANHRIQLKKLVPGRSKDIQLLIAEKKAAKDSRAEENFRQNTTYVPVLPYPKENETQPVNNFGPIMAKITITSDDKEALGRPKLEVDNDIKINSTSNASLLKKNIIESVNNNNNENNTGLENGFHIEVQTNTPQEIAAIPVVFMPMSPVSAVAPVQKGDVVCFESPQPVFNPPITPESVYFTIPDQINVKMYKSHPKPVSLPTFGARKVGSVLSKQRLGKLRSEILQAINEHSRQANQTVSILNNTTQRPKILKSKSNSKIKYETINLLVTMPNSYD